MILTAHQPVYLPWLGLFHRIALADTFVYFDAVQYQTHDWNNRNRIKTSQGVQWLTVPVLHTNHQRKRLFEIEIDNTRPWGQKHWRSIQQNYCRAPYFHTYAPFLEDMYSRKWQHLTVLNEYFLTWCLSALGIFVQFSRASDSEFLGVKSDLVLDMCKQMKADIFIFGSLGAHYAETTSFENAGITVLFQNYIHPIYPQLYGDFVSHLSIIDLLMNCGPNSMEIIMDGNIQNVDTAIKEYEIQQQEADRKTSVVILRKVLKEDCQLLWEWANDPATRRKSFSIDPIPWERHREWWRTKINDPACYMYMGVDGKGYPIGQIRFDCAGNTSEVDIHIDPAKRNRGYGTRLITLGINRLFAETAVQEVHALIRENNLPSIRSFAKAGFVYMGTKMIQKKEVRQYVFRRSS